MARRSILGVILLLSALTGSALAQRSYPMLMSLEPVAAQTGQASEHTIHSRYSMYGAYQVLVTGEGVTGEILHPELKESEKDKPPNLQTMQVRFTVADDALPGVRDFRIATPQGVSTLGQLVIVRDGVIREAAKNDTTEGAQEIQLPATVCGAIERAEDVDFYKFRVGAQTALNFHVRCMRLQDRIHDLQQHADPIITLRHASGTTLASSDNYFFGDPCLHYQFDSEGEYLLEIRDVRYQGNKYWQYSIEIADRPFVANVFPMGIARGQDTQLELIGFDLPEDSLTTVNIPADRPTGPRWMPLPMDESHTNPAPLVISDLPITSEQAADNNTIEQAQLFSAPAGINGRIESSADIDCYAFQAKQGERYTLEVVARRQQSGLDSHLRILDANGKQLAVNDDMRIGKRTFSDSQVENWSAPADGRYCLEVRDLHLRGGPSFVYFLKVTGSQPHFQLFVDTDKTQLTPGTGGVIFVRAERKNGFQGEIQLHIDGLPQGVTASCGRILAGKGQDGCIILHAGPDTPLGVANVSITGTATQAEDDDQQAELLATASSYQETYQPGGGRGHWPVEMHTVSVAAPSDLLSVTLSENEVVLKPGESKQIEVTVQRAEGFDKNVTLDVIYKHLSGIYGNSLPEGVTLDAKNSKTLLTGETSQGHITLIASDSAPAAQQQQIPVMANVSINFVMKATYAAQPLLVTVVEK